MPSPRGPARKSKAYQRAGRPVRNGSIASRFSRRQSMASLFRRAAVPFRIAHASSKEIIAWHDDRADGLSDRCGDGGLARTTPSINGHDESLWADRAGTNRGDYGVHG